MWWRCPLNIIYTELSIQHFDVTFCVFSLVESSWASSRTVWSCRQEKLPPPSIPLGGDMPLWAGCIDTAFFMQLSYGIATECCLRSAGLLPEYQKKTKVSGKLYRLSLLGLQLSSEQNSLAIKTKKAGDSPVDIKRRIKISAVSKWMRW